jgi:hypothetical protein
LLYFGPSFGPKSSAIVVNGPSLTVINFNHISWPLQTPTSFLATGLVRPSQASVATAFISKKKSNSRFYTFSP